MLKQSASILYKKQFHATTETASYHKREFLKESLHSMVSFNTYVLNEGSQLSLMLSEHTQIIIPLVGALDVVTKTENHFVATEGVIALPPMSRSENSITILNPYKTEKVHFILVEAIMQTTSIVKQNFKIVKNQLVSINITPDIKMHIGFYTCKEDVVLHLNKNTLSSLCYSSYGVLEVNYRLIDSGDAIAFLEDTILDIETLSLNALIFVFEVKG